ncbi:MAG: HYR domain-containing protein [Bacteroidetes bacterium]|nr:MAG: HYR domain-containing protein [Bacteroidota bacterium]
MKMGQLLTITKRTRLPLFRRFLLIAMVTLGSMFFGIQEANAHATQVGYCVLNNGLVRVYIEHWHGNLNQNNLNNNGIGLTISSSQGTTSIPNLDPDGYFNDTTIGNLPGCGANINVVSACPGTGFGSANFHNDWVYYDFPPLACGEQITITINAGNTVLLTEACGSLYPATINATFFDSGGPVLTCPDVNVTSCNPITVTYPAPSIVDDCDPNPMITGYSHPSGSTFQPGSTQVTVTSIDNQNQVGTCNFNVNVNPPPGGCCPASLQLSSNPTSPTCPGGNDGSIDLSVGAGTAPYSYSWSNGANTQDISGLTDGSYTVNVMDANGCTDMLTVNLPDGVDNTGPTAICKTATALLNANGQASITPADVNNNSYDLCGIAGYSVSPNTFHCGQEGQNVPVTLTVTDVNGNSSTCNTTVHVDDQIDPEAGCMDITVYLDENGNVTITEDDVENGSTDNCGWTNALSVIPSSFNCSNVGPNTVTVRVGDGNGNQDECTGIVTVVDNSNPEITCPGDITQSSDSGQCGANVSFNVTASDNCGQTTVVCTIGGDGSEPSDCYGNTVILTLNLDDFPSETTWMLMDGNGIVLESGGPYFTPGATITETFTLADGDYMFMIKDAFGDGICCLFGEGSYTLTSNGEEIVSGGEFAEGEKTNFCVEAQSGGSGMPLTEVESGDFFPVGTTTVTCTVTDANGLTDVCTFDITVNDTEAPMIATPCPGTITRCGAQTVSWTPPTATDNCAVVSTVSNYNPGDFFTVGTHTVTYTFSDAAGLSVSCSFDVVINPLPEVEITQDDLPTWCQGIKVLTAEVLNPEVLTFPLTYNWSDGLGNASQVIAPANGTYFVTVTDALGCFTVESTTIDVDISTLLSAYTIISGEEFEMYLSDVIGGGVGIEDADEAEVALNSNIFTFFRADADNVQVDGSSFINNFIDADFNIPFPAFQSNPFNNFNNVNVAGNSTMTLSGTNYGNVYVGFGATLIIDNADIHLRSLTTAKDATIIFNQPTEMKIRRKMYIGETNTVNPDGHTIVIFVSDNASVGQGSNVIANIYAPEGLDVNDSGSSLTTYMTGMFISNDRISSDHNVVWNWNLNCSYLPDTQPPIIDYSEQIDVNTPESSITDKDDFNVYPNPTAGLLNIDVTSFLDESMEIEMFNALGKIVWRQKVDRLETTLITANMTNLADGVYFLQVTSNGKRLSKQIILNK